MSYINSFEKSKIIFSICNDGSVKETEYGRYVCYHRSRGLNDCDGATTYKSAWNSISPSNNFVRNGIIHLSFKQSLLNVMAV